MNRIKLNAATGLAAVLLVVSTALQASGINGINNGMPNRISMNVTVPKQTQGATFGEKVNAGLHAAGNAVAQGAALSLIIECGQPACVVTLPDGDGYRADLQRRRVEVLKSNKLGDANAERGSGQGASLPGGALPGGSIVSAAVSSIGGMAKPGGAVSSSYARAAQSTVASEAIPSRRLENGDIDLLDPLADGDYLLTLVVEKATRGLKDTLKTQVRAAAAPQQLRIDLVFSVEAGVLKTRHDTARNSISNVR